MVRGMGAFVNPLRSLILAAAGNDVIRRAVATAPVSRDVVRRFVAGETTADAIAVTRRLVDAGLFKGATISHQQAAVLVTELGLRVL